MVRVARVWIELSYGLVYDRHCRDVRVYTEGQGCNDSKQESAAWSHHVKFRIKARSKVRVWPRPSCSIEEYVAAQSYCSFTNVFI